MASQNMVDVLARTESGTLALMYKFCTRAAHLGTLRLAEYKRFFGIEYLSFVRFLELGARCQHRPRGCLSGSAFAVVFAVFEAGTELWRVLWKGSVPGEAREDGCAQLFFEREI